MKTWIALVFLALLVRPVLAQLGGCPNTKARDVAATVSTGAASTTCQLGISLFGLTIGVDAGSCPDQIYGYPAHKACLGDANPGTYCGAGPTAPVSLHRCSCVVIGGDVLSISLPLCKCRYVGIAGTIPTGQTFVCIDN